MTRAFCFTLLLVTVSGLLPAQEALRGELRIDLEPIHGPYVDEKYPLDTKAAALRALTEGAVFFSAMIYGWSFYYDIGEKARGIAENFELEPLGNIPFGDPGLRVTDVRIENGQFKVWIDYRPDQNQLRRLGMWKSGLVRAAQAVGYGPLGGPVEISDWLVIKKAALEDAARGAVRALLRGNERNRPKEARGYISLSAFPSFYMDGGRWAASARFRVELTEIQPFAAY
ncbi:MAG: hypothetical protein LBL43_08625 [Treponema sp.]|nr:hypothetical protein [Treponema sp.]